MQIQDEKKGKGISSVTYISKIKFCQSCKNMGFILGLDENDIAEKFFIEECPECNA